MKKLIFIFLLTAIVACVGPEARKPVQVKSASFMKGSVERSKKLLAQEELEMKAIAEKDTLQEYIESASGSLFHYVQKDESSNYFPQTDDVVTLQYNILSFNNDTIYSKEEIGTLSYKVDKQELFQGLRQGIKLLKENETATFLFPSSLAYGYPGDNNKIGHNVPIKSTISILKIEKHKDSIQN